MREYKDSDRFDVILMNPPYGGNEKEGVKQNFPADLRSSETADLFMSVIMYRLKQNGRCAIILPDGFLFGTDNAKMAIKEKPLSEFNLHTVIRMPHSVFCAIHFYHNKHSVLRPDASHDGNLVLSPGYAGWIQELLQDKAHEVGALCPGYRVVGTTVREITIDGFDKAKANTPSRN